jgi:hypothetical protein
MKDPTRWIPLRVFWQGSRPMVDWGYLGTRRLTDPFFGQTIDACVRHPADLLFRHQTPLDELGEVAPTQASVPIKGFIFHMSRCGSTLISQMLAAEPANIVLSEAAPIDDILRAQYRLPDLPGPQRIAWLQAMVKVLAWQRQATEQHAFIKFDCWHVMFLPLIQRAFPEVPWIFLYREPLEVLVSQAGHMGGQMVPGVLEPGLFGWDAATLSQMHFSEYGARVLARICETALQQTQNGRGRLVNYRQLPEAIWPELLAYWKVDFTPGQHDRMRAAARLNAKNPVLPFEPDSEAKRNSAPPELRALARQWLDGVYQQLEARRREQESA